MDNGLIFMLVAIPSILVFWGYIARLNARDDAATREWITRMLQKYDDRDRRS